MRNCGIWKRKLILAICIILLLFIQGTMMYLNKIGASAYNGVLMAFQFVACLIMVKTDYIWGMIFSYALIIGGIANILYIMLRFHSYSALPGLCNMLIYIVTLSLLGHQFYIRDRESVTDYLTGLENLRGLFQYLQKKVEKRTPFTLYILIWVISN